MCFYFFCYFFVDIGKVVCQTNRSKERNKIEYSKYKQTIMREIENKEKADKRNKM